VSQLKICDFSGQSLKGFEVLQFSMIAVTIQLLSCGEICKLCYDTIPVKSFFGPMPPPVRTNFVVFSPGCGDSVADF